MITQSAYSLARVTDTRDHDREDDWHLRGACLSEDPEAFFPHPSDLAGITEAKAICQPCLVLDLCRDRALDDREQYGVWGGLDEDERRRALRRRTQASSVGGAP